MGLRWVQKNISPISVDFGYDSLKLLQVVTEDPPQLIAAASIEIPEDVRDNSEAYRKFLTTSLKELLRQGKFRGRRAVASLSAAHTYVQHVRLSKVEGVRIEQQLETELIGRLPLNPGGMVIRHVSVGEVFTDGMSKQEVICLAASREMVLRHVELARAAGLDIVGMHCEPLAIIAAFAHLFRRRDDVNRTTFFIDIGGSTTKAMIAHGKQLVFAKTIQVGGEHLNRQLAERLNIDPDTARQNRINEALQNVGLAMRQQVGQVALPADGQRRGPQTGNMPGLKAMDVPQAEAADGSGRVLSATAVAEPEVQTEVQDDAGRSVTAVMCEMEVLDCLIDELQLCIGYHASMFTDRPVEKVVFLGGESRHLTMCQKIARALRLPAQLGDPLARLARGAASTPPIGVELRKPQPGWAVPMGMCLMPTSL